jgi:hypothetical protein
MRTLMRYIVLGDDLKVHEHIILDRMGQLCHWHQERLEGYKLGKRYHKQVRERVPWLDNVNLWYDIKMELVEQLITKNIVRNIKSILMIIFMVKHSNDCQY